MNRSKEGAKVVKPSDLPSPPISRAEWPWTSECLLLPAARPDGSGWPSITIVTPSFNQCGFLEEAIRSVLLQGYRNLQYIVMDGGSTDGSIEIIRKYESWLDHWETRQDGGQANALNRALRLATGHWFHNVNSDDLLLPGALATIGTAQTDHDLIATPVRVFAAGGAGWISPNRDICLTDMIRARPRKVKWHQPGVFMRTEHIRLVGGFPEGYFLWDYILTALYIERFENVLYLDKQLVKFRVHPLAQTAVVRMREQGHFVAARNYLALKLFLPRNRAFSRREALRTSLHNILLSESDVHNANDNAFVKATRHCLRSPTLFFDRVFLASFKKLILRAMGSKFPRNTGS